MVLFNSFSNSTHTCQQIFNLYLCLWGSYWKNSSDFYLDAIEAPSFWNCNNCAYGQINAINLRNTCAKTDLMNWLSNDFFHIEMLIIWCCLPKCRIWVRVVTSIFSFPVKSFLSHKRVFDIENIMFWDWNKFLFELIIFMNHSRLTVSR